MLDVRSIYEGYIPSEILLYNGCSCVLHDVASLYIVQCCATRTTLLCNTRRTLYIHIHISGSLLTQAYICRVWTHIFIYDMSMCMCPTLLQSLEQNATPPALRHCSVAEYAQYIRITCWICQSRLAVVPRAASWLTTKSRRPTKQES